MVSAQGGTAAGRDLGYLRISLDTEESGSIANQRRLIRAAVESRGGDPDAVVWFTDETVSGSKVRFAERPDGGRLLRELRPGDRVTITKVDRAGRNTRDLLDLHDRIGAAGASVAFLDLNVDTSTPTGELVFTVMAALARWEARNIGARRVDALEGFAAEGRHAVGKAPFGFLSVPNPNGRGLVIVKDPEAAPLVRDAVLRVLAGEPQDSVRHSLGLSKTGFGKLLRNPRLAGMTPRNGGVVMVNGEPLVNPDAAILSMSEWRALEAFISRSDKAWTRHTGFGRALECGVCGERLYFQASRRNEAYSTYKCRKPAGVHPADAPGLGVTAAKVEAHIEAEFLRMWGEYPYRVLTVAEDDSRRREAVAAASVRVDALERRMRAADRSERQTINADLMAAYDALEDARSLPSERREVVSDSGRTIGDVWRDSDTAAREAIVSAFGAFVVSPGRGALADRVAWSGLEPIPVTVNDRPGQFVLVLDSPEATQRSFGPGAPARIAPAGPRVEVRPL